MAKVADAAYDAGVIFRISGTDMILSPRLIVTAKNVSAILAVLEAELQAAGPAQAGSSLRCSHLRPRICQVVEHIEQGQQPLGAELVRNCRIDLVGFGDHVADQGSA